MYVYLFKAWYGRGSGPIVHNNLRCTSHELSLSDCPGTHGNSLHFNRFNYIYFNT